MLGADDEQGRLTARSETSRQWRSPMRTMALLLAGWLACETLAAPAPPSKEARPLPEELVKAWQKAGAKTGWMGPYRRYGHSVFMTDRKDLDEARMVPAFQFSTWRAGVTGTLAAPAAPFGLH